MTSLAILTSLVEDVITGYILKVETTDRITQLNICLFNRNTH